MNIVNIDVLYNINTNIEERYRACGLALSHQNAPATITLQAWELRHLLNWRISVMLSWLYTVILSCCHLSWGSDQTISDKLSLVIKRAVCTLRKIGSWFIK